MPFRCFIPLFLLIFNSAWAMPEKPAAQSRVVIVSIAPYKFFVEAIAGDTVEVLMMVPTGGSPHSYEPTTKQVLSAGKADLWFRIGETFEIQALQALKGHNPRLIAIDMRDGMDMISVAEDGHHHCQHHGCLDPHIWLSPKLVAKQAEIITKSLSLVYPENAKRYQTALRKFQKRLHGLDVEIANIIRQTKNRTLLVSHPAYAYFCRDYGLNQLSIEFEGKDPSPRQLTKTLNMAREGSNQVVFVQAQHLGKGARLVAAELGAKVVELDPLNENYFENMLKIARNFAAQ